MARWRLPRALRIAGLGLGAVVVIFLAALLALLVVLQSDRGRARILTTALPLAQRALVGRLTVSALEGDVVRWLALRDVVLLDREGREAVRAARIEARYDLLALLRRTVRVSAVSVAGLKVHGRLLRDGRLNLAALHLPAVEPTPPSGPLPVRLRISGIGIEGALHYQDGTGGTALSTAVLLAGAVDVTGDHVHVRLDRLDLATRLPLQAGLSLRGGLHVGDGPLRVEQVELRGNVKGEEIDRVLAAAQLRGSYQLRALVNGPLADLRTDLTLDAPRGSIKIGAALDLDAAPPRWHASAEAIGIDPSALRADLPAGLLSLLATGEGQGVIGAIDLKRLAVHAVGAELRAKGRASLDGNGSVEATLAVPDLARLGSFVGLALRGRLDLRAEAQRSGREIRIRTLGQADTLQVSALRADHLSFDVRGDINGRRWSSALQLDSAGLAVRDLLFATVTLSGRGDADLIELRARGEGPRKTALRLALRGRPLLGQSEEGPAAGPALPQGLDATLEELLIGRAGERWTGAGPARLQIGPSLTVSGLALTSGEQRVALDGHLDRGSGAVKGRIEVQALDLQRVAALVIEAPGPGAQPVLPRTRLDLQATLGGTLGAPTLEAQLKGETGAFAPLSLPAARWDVQTGYGGGRARADVLLVGTAGAAPGKTPAKDPAAAVEKIAAKDRGTAVAPRLRVHLDAPVASLAAPLAAELELAAALPLFRPFLPPDLADLEGEVQLRAEIGGTPLRPTLHLLTTAPRFRSALVAGERVVLDLGYKDERLSIGLASQLRSPDDNGRLGDVRVDLGAPVALGAGLPIEELRRRGLRAPLSGRAVLKIDRIAEALRVLLREEPPLLAGAAELSIQMGGTVLDPRVGVRLSGTGLATPTIADISLRSTFDYDGTAAKVGGEVTLRGAPLLRLSGALPLTPDEIFGGRPGFWKKLPITAEARIPDFPLERLDPTLGGRLGVALSLGGTLGAPLGTIEGRGRALRFAGWRAGDLDLQAKYEGKQAQATLSMVQGQVGRLRLAALVPVQDPAGSLRVDLDAKDFTVDFEHQEGSTGPLRVVRGVLDADLHLTGPPTAPHAEGRLHLRNGQLGLAADPQLYQGVEADLLLDRAGQLTLRRLAARAGEGLVEVKGSVQIDGVRPPSRIDLQLTATNFPLAAGSMALWIDASAGLHAKTTDGVLRGALQLESGTVRLPKITSGRNMQALGPLQDVRYVDARARREQERERQRVAAAERAERAAQQAKEPAAGPRAPGAEAETQREFVNLRIEVPGPLHVRGREVGAELSADLLLSLRGGLVLLSGTARSMSGWVEIIGRRYEIDRAVVSLDGAASPNPILDVRVSRRSKSALLIVEVRGTARRPIVTFRSEPPIYSESQIIAIVMAGEGDTVSAAQKPEQKALGAISGLLIGQLKEQLLGQLPLDVLKVDVAGQDYNLVSRTRIELGKYILENLYVGYALNLGASGATRRTNLNEVTVEYRFLRNFLFTIVFGDAGVGSVDLYWTRRF